MANGIIQKGPISLKANRSEAKRAAELWGVKYRWWWSTERIRASVKAAIGKHRAILKAGIKAWMDNA